MQCTFNCQGNCPYFCHVETFCSDSVICQFCNRNCLYCSSNAYSKPIFFLMKRISFLPKLIVKWIDPDNIMILFNKG